MIFFLFLVVGVDFLNSKSIILLRLENIVEEEGRDGNLRQSERTTQLLSWEKKRSSMERERETLMPIGTGRLVSFHWQQLTEPNQFNSPTPKKAMNIVGQIWAVQIFLICKQKWKGAMVLIGHWSEIKKTLGTRIFHTLSRLAQEPFLLW